MNTPETELALSEIALIKETMGTQGWRIIRQKFDNEMARLDSIAELPDLPVEELGKQIIIRKGARELLQHVFERIDRQQSLGKRYAILQQEKEESAILTCDADTP